MLRDAVAPCIACTVICWVVPATPLKSPLTTTALLLSVNNPLSLFLGAANPREPVKGIPLLQLAMSEVTSAPTAAFAGTDGDVGLSLSCSVGVAVAANVA